MTTVTRQIHFAIEGKRKRAVAGPPPEPAPDGRVPRVSRLLALAIRFDKLLRDGVVSNQSELARLVHVTQPRMTQILNLLHLAPDIQEEILFLPPTTGGRDSIHEHMLRPVAACTSWTDQRRQWALIIGQTNVPASP